MTSNPLSIRAVLRHWLIVITTTTFECLNNISDVEGGCLDDGYFVLRPVGESGYFCSDVVESGCCLLDNY